MFALGAAVTGGGEAGFKLALRLVASALWVGWGIAALLAGRAIETGRGTPEGVERARRYVKEGFAVGPLVATSGIAATWPVDSSRTAAIGALLVLALLVTGYYVAFRRLRRKLEALRSDATALSPEALDAVDRLQPWLQLLLGCALAALVLALRDLAALA